MVIYQGGRDIEAKPVTLDSVHEFEPPAMKLLRKKFAAPYILTA